MAFTARRIRVGARIVASVSLFVGLANALHALGVSGSVSDPVAGYGQMGFAVLTIIACLRLFAAVGLWAYATWGAFLLLFASMIEIVVVGAGVGALIVTPMGFGLSVALLASSVGLLVWRFLNIRAQGKRL
ncbi:hypothetical protein [Maritalea porphyrae]|uniref:Phage holin family protein n=1 Tax=Maritalea porphyrae TaxID=880732 RepID=A0ABQ5UUX5_9HYPH|nr:hypothetical protein [Maritalea porphyrae]GLQ18216.1 hypothetical protein GCM10007879_24650 [Maritalea porphyrae]